MPTYKNIAKISLWKSRAEAKTAFNGQVQWENGQASVAFLDLLETKELTGKIIGDDGNFVVTVEKNESDNPNAPVAKGGVFTADSGERIYEIALWHSKSDNPKAPVYTGKIQEIKNKE